MRGPSEAEKGGSGEGRLIRAKTVHSFTANRRRRTTRGDRTTSPARSRYRPARNGAPRTRPPSAACRAGRMRGWRCSAGHAAIRRDAGRALQPAPIDDGCGVAPAFAAATLRMRGWRPESRRKPHRTPAAGAEDGRGGPAAGTGARGGARARQRRPYAPDASPAPRASSR